MSRNHNSSGTTVSVRDGLLGPRSCGTLRPQRQETASPLLSPPAPFRMAPPLNNIAPRLSPLSLPHCSHICAQPRLDIWPGSRRAGMALRGADAIMSLCWTDPSSCIVQTYGAALVPFSTRSSRSSALVQEGYLRQAVRICATRVAATFHADIQHPQPRCRHQTLWLRSTWLRRLRVPTRDILHWGFVRCLCSPLAI